MTVRRRFTIRADTELWEQSGAWYAVIMAHKTATPTYNARYTVAMGARGRIVVPARLREQMQLAEGDRLVLRVRDDGVLEVVSLREQLDKLRGIFKDDRPGVSLVDELIAERRAEARKEDME